MSTAFAIDPSSSIFRAVKNGDNALSPSSMTNVLFDAYGNKVHGLSLQGTVPFSAFSGPTSMPVPSGASSANYYYYQINFPQTLPYIPFLFLQIENSAGVWTPTYSAGSVTLNPTRGTGVGGGGFATQSYLLLYLQVVNYPNAVSWVAPANYSYRLFGV